MSAETRRDFVTGLRASGPDKGVYTACAYCGRSMPLSSISGHVAVKHPRRKTCA